MGIIKPEHAPPHNTRKFVVARVEDVPKGNRIVVELQGREVGVFHVGDNFYALLNRCPHQGGPLCRGEIVALIEADAPGQYRFLPDTMLLTCPWHGWEFDLKDGQSYFDPQRTKARPYRVEVEQGNVIARVLQDEGHDVSTQLKKGPYVAETIEVSVENDYLILTMRT